MRSAETELLKAQKTTIDLEQAQRLQVKSSKPPNFVDEEYSPDSLSLSILKIGCRMGGSLNGYKITRFGTR